MPTTEPDMGSSSFPGESVEKRAAFVRDFIAERGSR
jgi:hypothetical protein